MPSSALRLFALVATALGCAGGVLALHCQSPNEAGLVAIERAARIVSNSPRLPEALGRDMALPDDWRRSGLKGDTAWYRLTLPIEEPGDALWALYIPSLEMSPTVYLNGVHIGGEQAQAGPLARWWNRPLLFSMPSKLLLAGRNEVAIRLQANGPWGRLSRVYAGPEPAARAAYERRRFLRTTLGWLGSWAALLAALGAGLVWWSRREGAYAWFAVFCGCWAFQAFYAFRVVLPFGDALWGLTIYAADGWLATSGSLFLFRLFGLHRPRLERSLLVVSAAGPLLGLLPLYLFSGPSFLSSAGKLVWQGAALLLGICAMTFALRHGLRERSAERFLLGSACVMAFALGIYDWLIVLGVGFRHSGLLLHFATIPMVASFGAIVLQRYVRALDQSEALVVNLESRVREKTAEVEAQHRRTRSLEMAQALTEERERIVRDLHDGFGGRLIGSINGLDTESPRERGLRDELCDALADLRLMMDSLDPVDNDVGMAVGMLRSRVEPQFRRAGIELRWKAAELPPVEQLGPERTLHFLRVVQEALTNALKHSRARCVSLSMHASLTIDGVRCAGVVVSDDGIGFDPAATYPSRGLVNMRYRARAACLALAIYSRPPPARGAEVSIGFPLATGLESVPDAVDGRCRVLAEGGRSPQV